MSGRKTRGLQTAVASLLSQLGQAQRRNLELEDQNRRLRSALELVTADPASSIGVIDAAVREALRAANKRHGRMSEKIRLLRMEVELLRKDPSKHRQTFEALTAEVQSKDCRIVRQMQTINELHGRLREYEKHTPGESEG